MADVNTEATFLGSLPPPPSLRAGRRAIVRARARVVDSVDPSAKTKQLLQKLTHGSALREIKFSGAVSLLANQADTRKSLSRFYRTIEKAMRVIKPTPIFIDLRDVTDIDAPSMLFLVAVLSRIPKGGHIFFGGNRPSTQRVGQLLADVGFWDCIRTTTDRHPTPIGHARISMGTRNQEWHEIRNFLVDRTLPRLAVEEADAFYLALAECIENVGSHAYPTKEKERATETGRAGQENSDDRRWYAVGIIDAQSSQSTVAILDLGVGIPSTVQRKASVFGVAQDALRSDSEWLVLSTQGERHRTGERKRGKGLSGLRERCTGADRRRLSLSSGRGSITVDAGGIHRDDYPAALPGTVVSLEIMPGIATEDKTC